MDPDSSPEGPKEEEAEREGDLSCAGADQPTGQPSVEVDHNNMNSIIKNDNNVIINHGKNVEGTSSTANNAAMTEKETGKWRELMGSDLLIKTLVPGDVDQPDDEEPSSSVQPQDAVVVDFTGWYGGDYRPSTSEEEEEAVSENPSTIFQQVSDWLIVIGEKDVVPVLEMGIRFMNKGETALIWAHSKYAYGPAQRSWSSSSSSSQVAKKGEAEASSSSSSSTYTLPPHSNVLYIVTVKSIIPAERLTEASFQIELAMSKKEIGNDIYRNEWLEDYSYAKSRALQQYQRGAQLMQSVLQSYEQEEGEEAEEEGSAPNNDKAIAARAREVMLDCFNNVTAVHLRANEYKAAKESAVNVLTHDPDNFKGLIRAAKAALMDPGSSFEEVEAALEAAAAKAEGVDDHDLQRLRADFVRRKHEYNKKTKEMYSRIGKAMKEKGAGEEEEVAENKGTQEDVGDNAKDDGSQVGEDMDNAKLEGTKESIPTMEENTTEETSSESQVENILAPAWWDWKHWDWKNIILPYGIQLIMPLITYYVFTIMKRQQQEAAAAGSLVAPPPSHNDNEFDYPNDL